MKIAHTGDLHIGKRLHEQSLMEDQSAVLGDIVEILKEHKVEALIIAGDIYDKPNPSAEAVKLFDDFVYDVGKNHIRLFVISGNHDSMEKISFGSRIMAEGGVYFQENFDSKAQRHILTDEYGELNIYLLPFIKPAALGKESYEEAVKCAIEATQVDFSKRNILVAHQFITATEIGEEISKEDELIRGRLPERAESETVNVGGLDNISYKVVKDFDYVALGHLHRRQSIGMDHIRYAGSPLKYSFSEGNDIKSIEIIELMDKGNLTMSQVNLVMPKDLRTIKGTLEHLISEEVVNGPDMNREDYIRAVITNEDRVADAANKLLRWYPNLLKIEYEQRSREQDGGEPAGIKGKSPMELFVEYYEIMNGRTINESERQIVAGILGGD